MTIRFEFTKNQTLRSSFSGLPNEQLALELALSLCNLVHPHGTVGTRQTAQLYCGSIRKFARFLADQGFREGLAELTTSLLLGFFLAHADYDERSIRLILQAFDEHVGDLRADVREQVNGRRRKKEVRKAIPFSPYSETEWSRLTECCTKITDDAWRLHVAATQAGKRSRNPAVIGVTARSLAWLMLRRGPIGVEQAANLIGPKLWGTVGQAREREHRALIRTVRTALFPTQEVQLAYRLLFGIHTGIVADGIDDLELNGIDWAGRHVALVKYVKGRTGPEGLSLSPTASRLLLRWLEHSAPLRAVIPAENRNSLWVSIPTQVQSGKTIFDGATYKPINSVFVEKYALTADDGAPLKLHRNRIRTTYLSLLSRKGWTGRTLIDPNHSANVEGDHYLTVTTPAQQDMVDSIIEDSQSDLLRKALTPKVFSDDQIETAAIDLLQSTQGIEGDGTTVSELLSGSQDVFVASCLDHTGGQWGPAGAPCPARPWVCLLCPLAIFMPRHAPNLLRLQAFFARQFRAMPLHAYLRAFGPYAQRLESDILPRFDAAVITAAASQVEDRDDELPIRPEERSL